MATLRKRTRTDGTVAIAVLYTLNGHQTSVTFDDEAGAEDFRAAIDTIGAGKAMLAWGITPTAKASTARSTAPTVQAWLARYIAGRTGVTKTTIYDYTSYARLDINPAIGQIPLDVLSPDDIADWVQTLEDRGLAGKTIGNRHGFLSAALNTAVRDGIIPANPALGTRIPRTERKDMVFLDHGEYALLRSCIPELWRPMVDFLVASGARFGEVSALKPSDVNRARSTVYIGRGWKRTYDDDGYEIGATKTKRSVRTISIDKTVLDALDYTHEWLFVTPRGNPVRAVNFRNHVWYPAIAAAKVRGLAKKPRVHDLRHTCASWLVQAGQPLPVVQAHLGHESISTTVGLYTHLDRASADAAAAVIGKALRFTDEAGQ